MKKETFDTKTGPAAHSPLGASSASRWMNCPGSIRLTKGMTGETSEFAALGTAAHEVGELALKQDCDAAAFLGRIIKVEGFEFEVDDDMVEAVQVYLNAVRKELNRARGQDLAVENKFKLEYLHPNLWGTNDACVIQAFGRLTVFDYKHGAGVVVEVEHNVQLMYYALGAMMNMIDCDEIKIVVVQPRARHQDGPVRSWTCTPEYLEEWGKNELLPAALETEKDGAKVAAGDWCRWCRVFGSCKVAANRNLSMCKDAFTPVIVKADNLKPIALLDDTQLGWLVQNESVFKAWYKEAMKTAYLKIKAGTEIPGCKLVGAKSNRKWIDEVFAAKSLRELLGGETYSKPKLVTPAQAEAALKKLGKKPAAISALTSYLWEKPEGGTVIVPDSDRREAIKSDSAFSGIKLEDEI